MATALRDAESWLRPAADKSVLQALGELWLKTVKPGGADDDMKAKLLIYARDLRAYPGDIVLSIIGRWRRQFFPTFDELATAIEEDRDFRKRHQTVIALRRAQIGTPPPIKRITPEEIEAVKRKYANAEDLP